MIVQTRDAVYTYTLDTDGNALTVGSDAGWVSGPDPVNPQTGQRASALAGSHRPITLVTRSELFHTNGRLVAFGHLTHTAPPERSGGN